MAIHISRVERQARLLKLIPKHGEDALCPKVSDLLETLGSLYGEDAEPAARRRALQRDLGELVERGEIALVNPGGKPLRYRLANVAAVDDDDPYVLSYVRERVREVVEAEFPAGHFDAVWKRFLQDESNVGLGPDKLRVLSDTQRLRPADIDQKVLADVLEALALSATLQVTYRNRDDKVSKPTLHPQAFIQRGPRAYLFALKGDETGHVRMYALHRFTRTEVTADPARQAADFRLDDFIRRGQADFAGGESAELELLARGYVAELLHDCPLSSEQRIDDEPDGSAFEVRVRATLPKTGQLLRWLLGCGNNVQVLAPDDLRTIVAEQAAKTAALYAAASEGEADTR